MMKHEQLTALIIGCFYDVYNELGYGFNEKIYERALVIALKKRGVAVKSQPRYEVKYMGELVGECFPDIIAGDDEVIIELKVAAEIIDPFKVQLISYMRAAGIRIGLILNFGPRPEMRRFMIDEKGNSVRVKPFLKQPESVGTSS